MKLDISTFSTIRKNLLSKSPTYECEKALITHITMKQEDMIVREAREFFLGDFSKPFLDYIAKYIWGANQAEILGSYYEFISSSGGENHIPYYKVSIFGRKHHATLRSYVSTITSRYFTQEHVRYLSKRCNEVDIDESTKVGIDFSKNEVIENRWFYLLLQNDDEIEYTANDLELLKQLEIAIARLPYREQLILKLMVMGDATGLEAFEELLPYINPVQPIDTMSDKLKQDTMSNLKKRALKHLKEQFSK